MEYIYAVLLLHKVGQPVNEDNLKKVISAAGIDVDESKVKSVIASLKGVDIEKALSETAIAPVASAQTSGGAATSKPETKKEERAEEAAEGLAALFG